VKSVLRRRPSPALVISLVALFVSLGGVSYGVATGFIDSREIKNNTIRSRDIRNNQIRTFDLRNNEVRGIDIRNSTVQGRDVALNTLTGSDVKESELGQVPQAAAAANAATVGGLSVRRFFVKRPADGITVELLRGDGFVLRGRCTAGAPVLELAAVAGAPETNAQVQGVGGTSAFSDSTTDLGSGALDLGDGSTSPTGTAVVSTTTGKVTTISYAGLGPGAFTGEPVCALRGTAVSG
jgi:hypothetical protein